MQTKTKLLVFPTSRAIRNHISKYKHSNTLLPFTLSIDEFLKKSIIIGEYKYCDEEQRFLFLKEAIKNTDIKKLGILDNFSSFLKQHEYIYRFFQELASEKIEISKIYLADTYEYYEEHLKILSVIRQNYINLLEKNSYVDKLNLLEHYKINKNFLDKFDEIEIFFEGYFTKQEFEIVEKIAKYKTLHINLHSNEYNKKSLEVFKDIIKDEKSQIDYKIDLTKKELISAKNSENKNKFLDIKSFSLGINQIAYIKHSIYELINKNISPSDIVVVLPNENFTSSLELFDKEKYFNYAMGKSIKTTALYQVANAINLYLSEDEIKHKKNLEFLQVDMDFVDNKLKNIWNKKCTKQNFEYIIEYLKSIKSSKELSEKFDELIYKLYILFFSNENSLRFKEVYKILLQRLINIKLDDINSGKITVMGLLETRAINFKAVIIPDFNENYIPKKSIKDKFLSTKLKKLASLPTNFDRESLQKYYYKRLINSCEYLYISYVNSDENQISRFANELFDVKIDTNTYDDMYKNILYNSKSLNIFDKIVEFKFDTLNFSWSASSLKTFLECKRRFYLNYILNIKEHDISLSPKPYELGNIIHKILEEFYKIDNRSIKDLEDLFSKYKSKNAFLLLDLEIWKKKLFDFYEYDKKRLESSKILDMEKAFFFNHSGLKLKGFIDRVDINNGKYEVIDYKTSSSLKIDTIKTYEKSTDFQLEFYYLAIRQLYKTDNIDVFYYDLSNTKLIKEQMCDKKLELLEDKFEEIKKLSGQVISFNKCDDQFCSYCNYDKM